MGPDKGLYKYYPPPPPTKHAVLKTEQNSTRTIVLKSEGFRNRLVHVTEHALGHSAS